jgi:hypothetical protein
LRDDEIGHLHNEIATLTKEARPMLVRVSGSNGELRLLRFGIVNHIQPAEFEVNPAENGDLIFSRSRPILIIQGKTPTVEWVDEHRLDGQSANISEPSDSLCRTTAAGQDKAAWDDYVQPRLFPEGGQDWY